MVSQLERPINNGTIWKFATPTRYAHLFFFHFEQSTLSATTIEYVTAVHDISLHMQWQDNVSTFWLTSRTKFVESTGQHLLWWHDFRLINCIVLQNKQRASNWCTTRFQTICRVMTTTAQDEIKLVTALRLGWSNEMVDSRPVYVRLHSCASCLDSTVPFMLGITCTTGAERHCGSHYQCQSSLRQRSTTVGHIKTMRLETVLNRRAR
jgi:hypothetical protein